MLNKHINAHIAFYYTIAIYHNVLCTQIIRTYIHAFQSCDLFVVPDMF